jgi:hypothetical protein
LLQQGEDRKDSFGTRLAASGDTVVVAADSGQTNSVDIFGLGADGRWTLQDRIFRLDDHYGSELAIDGNTLLVAARGVVLVFERTGSTWNETGRLLPQGDAAGFATSIALSGDRAIVAQSTNVAPAVHVYERSDGVWSHTATLQSSDPVTGDRFAAELALAGDIIAVGAPGDPDTGIGAAYLFEYVDGGWVQTVRVEPIDGAEGDHFGDKLALGEGMLVVGAHGHAIGATKGAGGAYVYRKEGSDWEFVEKLSAASPIQLESLGSSIALLDDGILLGAPYSNVTRYQQGVVRQFEDSGSSWSETRQLDSGHGLDSNGFGSEVAMAGELAVIAGRPFSDEAYVFRRRAEGWVPDGILPAEQTVGFRGAVAVAESSLLVGAMSYASVLSYERVNEQWQLVQRLEAGPELAGGRFGTDLATSGDWAMVGAPTATVNGSSEQGVVIAYQRQGGQWQRVAELTVGGTANDRFGSAVAMSGDTLVVGAPGFDSEAFGRHGAAYVFRLANGEWTEMARLHAPEPSTGNSFGSTVAVHADQVLVGSPRAQSSGAASAHLYASEGDEWRHEHSFPAPDEAYQELYASSLALSASNVMISAPSNANSPLPYHGSVLVYGRRGAEWKLLDHLVAEPNVARSGFGDAIALDGTDAIIGAPEVSGPLPFSNPGEGRAFVYSAITADSASLNRSYVYWNPTQPGWGLNLVHQGDQIFGTWYTYADDRQVRFLTIEATRETDHVFRGPVYQVSGIPFSQINGTQAFVSTAEVGQAELRFASGGDLYLIHEIHGMNGGAALAPFVFDSGAPRCYGTTVSRDGLTNYSDLWWNPAEPGWGLTLAHQGDIIFLLWYTYDEEGRDQWISASQLVRQLDGSYEGVLQRPVSGVPIHQIDGPATEFPVPSVGTARLQFDSGTMGRFEYTTDGISRSKTISRFEFVGSAVDKPLCF